MPALPNRFFSRSGFLTVSAFVKRRACFTSPSKVKSLRYRSISITRFILLVYRFCKRQLFPLPSGNLLESYTRKHYVESRLRNRSSARRVFYPFIRQPVKRARRTDEICQLVVRHALRVWLIEIVALFLRKVRQTLHRSGQRECETCGLIRRTRLAVHVCLHVKFT